MAARYIYILEFTLGAFIFILKDVNIVFEKYSGIIAYRFMKSIS